MKLASLVAAWLIGVLIGLETRRPLLTLLLLLSGSVTFGLALRQRGLPVFPAALALLLVVLSRRTRRHRQSHCLGRLRL